MADVEKVCVAQQEIRSTSEYLIEEAHRTRAQARAICSRARELRARRHDSFDVVHVLNIGVSASACDQIRDRERRGLKSNATP